MSLACSGNHAFIITNGSNLSHKMGHALLRECDLHSQRTLAGTGLDEDEVRTYETKRKKMESVSIFYFCSIKHLLVLIVN